MRIRGWKKLFAPQILARGEDYCDTGHVESVQFTSGTVTAEVWGSELYEAEIKLAGDRVEGMSCTCPYYILIQRLKKLKRYPQGQALALKVAQEWRETYKRRRSLLEELQTAGF